MTTTPNDRGAGRIETCTELISKAMKCLENNDKECVLERIRELIENNCHNGRVVGKEVADRSRGVIRELWFRTSHRQEEGCRLLRLLIDLGASVHQILGMSTEMRERWFRWCEIDKKGKVARNDVVEEIEDLLREKFGWSETKMCKELFKYIGIDVDEFRRHGIEPCVWLEGLEPLRNLRNPYWLGMASSDMYIKVVADNDIKLLLETTNSIDAILFPLLLSMVGRVSIDISKVPAKIGIKYVKHQILLTYRVNAKWPWPIELSAGVLRRILEELDDKGLTELIAGMLDGDGEVRYEKTVRINIFSIDALKSKYADVLKDVAARRFGIEIKRIEGRGLEITRENAVKLLRLIRPFVHHPLRRLRIELILALYDGKISLEEFKRLYEMTKYKHRAPDIKRNHALEAAIRAAPQTHTRGG